MCICNIEWCVFHHKVTMPTVTCAVVGCTNNTANLRKWRKHWCLSHNDIIGKGKCSCKEPYILYPFPKVTDPLHEKWVQAVNRYDPVSRKRWTPDRKYSRVCSAHFTDNKLTKDNPIPCLNMGYGTDPKQKTFRKPRTPPKERITVRKNSPAAKKNISSLFCEPTKEDMDTDTDRNLQEPILFHDRHCNKDNEYCQKCVEKDKTITLLRAKILQLERQLKKKETEEKKTMYEKLLVSDSKVQFYTGLPNIETFDLLFEFLQGKVAKMSYWRGPKYSTIRKYRNPSFFRSPKKLGPKRKLQLKDELLLVLMKLRLALIHEDLADRFSISNGTVSSLVTTWVKTLSKFLRPLINWPQREYVQAQLPSKILKQYPYLRAIIDCTEIYIERPRELLLQAHTWSDYKKSNTAKILVSITPRGAFNFISEAYGGRSSDKYIVHESGFLDLIEEYDQIMADNGFTIQEELLIRHAELVKPPPAKGYDQASRANVMSTKKVANIRIHVERAIQRLKTFRILSGTYPISMLSIMDDVICVCACMCNIDTILIR